MPVLAIVAIGPTTSAFHHPVRDHIGSSNAISVFKSSSNESAPSDLGIDSPSGTAYKTPY